MWWNKTSDKSSGKKAAAQKVQQAPRRKAMMMALEPRYMFDGAVAATHAEVAHQVHADAGHGFALDHLRPTAAQTEAAASGPAVVFIDSRVSDAASLLQGVAAGTEVVYLNANQDGLQQMASYLAAHPEVGSVEIIAHGNDGELLLGGTNLTSANINSYAQELHAIGSNLKQGADILVYACDTAADAAGQSFVGTLAQLTGHDVAASSGVVGINGGWDLDVTTGDISARPVLSAAAEAGYQYDLQTIQVTNGANAGAGSLRAAITTADTESGDVIYFSGGTVGVTSVALTSALPAITSSMTIESDLGGDGAAADQVTLSLSAAPAANAAVLTISSGTVNLNGLTIDANHDSGVLKITGGTVNLSNSTIEGGLLAGNGGGYGNGPGQNAYGAGISVSGAGTILKISNVVITSNAATGGGGGSANGTGSNYYGGGGGGGIAGVGGGSGGGYSSATAGTSGGGSVGGTGTGGAGGYVNPLYKGSGGSTTGGNGGTGNSFAAAGGKGATAGISTRIGGGGGAAGIDGSSAAGASGGSAAGGLYVGNGTKVYMSRTTFSDNYGAGGGGGGSYSNTGGSGGNAGGAVLVASTGILKYQSSSVTFTNNDGEPGKGGYTVSGHGGMAGSAGNISGSGGSTSGIWNLGVAGDVNSTYVPPPTVTASFISVSGDTGAGGDYRIGDTVTATWNNGASGDDNSTTITGVTFDFSQFGGGSAVAAVDVSNVWTATYTITAGTIDATGHNVAVTATDSGGSTTTTGTNNVTVDNKQPIVTPTNITLSGATGAGGTAFKIGDTVTVTWNDTALGDNNTDTINAGGVTMNLSAFGGGSAVTATNNGIGDWTASYVITSGAINTSTAHASVTVTDHAGNTTTNSGSAATVDDISPIVTSPNISVSGGSGPSGAFKIGDTVTATWNDTGTGDNNTDTINAGGVTMNFSAFGGGSAVVATNSSGVWTATYVITSGAINTSTAHVSVTATDYVGNFKTASGSAVTVDDIVPIVTTPNISLSGGSGPSGAFKIGDTVTATWNNSGTGDNNTDTINAGDVTMNFSQFGGGSAVTATNSGGVWTATYVITSGAIDSSNAKVSVTATDYVGNSKTTLSSAVTVDDITPIVTPGNISVSGASGAGGTTFKIGDVVTATWDDTVSGDNNTDTINAGGVTMNFSAFGGGTVTATNSGGVWTATYTVTSGSVNTAGAQVSVTATDHVGNATTISGSAVAVDNIAPIVTAPNISVSGGTGASGAFKIGDTVTATWNNSGTGDNNSESINAGGVTMNFSQFGGGAAVVATNNAGVWTATYTLTSGSIDTSTAHVAVTATDAVGNATTRSSSAVTADNEQPVVTAPNISLSGATGTGGAFKVGDTVTATWNDTGAGDNNTDTINAGGVTVNFSQFGGGTAVVATNSGGVWTATYTVVAGSINTSNAHVAVTATDHVGNFTTTSSAAASVDDIAPIVTAPNISLSGGTGTGGAFKIGDTVTATWNNSGTGDNNTDTINAGGVTMNFSQFGGGSAVVATNSGGVWTATYVFASGSIDTTTAHVAVTATDAFGNATTTSSSAVTADNEQPVVTSGNISLSGGTGTGGAFKVGDTVTATWNDTGAGDNNTDTFNAGGVTMDFSQFGGGSAVVATNSGGVWTATYTVTAGSINTSNAHVAVTATDHAGNTATTSGAAATVDDIAPIVTTPNILLSGGTGTSGAFKIGDTVTATWNNSGTGDNNTDTINAGGVTMNFSQFGGGSAVVATNSGGVWTATYVITSGSIDTATAHVAVTATDAFGNATTTSGSAVTADNEQPVVTTGNISLSGGTGSSGAFKIGDTVTATWNNTGAGDNNTDTINAGGVTMNFSQFGGGSAVVATNSGGVWTATYTITSGAIDTATAHVAVTTTDHVGNTTTTSGSAATVDDISLVVTAPNISVSGGTGTSGAFKIGDTVTATWDNSGTGDNNTDPINAGGVTMNFSQFGGGTAVVATNSGGVWTATYTITAGAINSASAHVAVTATDHVGNATTTSGSAVTVDDISPVVTSGNITLSGGTGSSGAFKIGDTVTATWNNSGMGDNNTDTINAGGVTMNFSQFGGGSAVVATNSGGVWTASYTITAGSIDTTAAHVAVTTTDYVGNVTTTSGSAVTAGNEQPVVTTPNISVSGGTGTGGAFKIGDTVTATWDNSGAGDNNTDTINAGGVTMNFSQFGGGTAVVATNSGGVWTATYTVTAGAIDTTNAHVAGTATDRAGNATTTSGSAVTVDDIQPVVTSIAADSATVTNASTVSYTVTFSEGVTGVVASDFTLTTTGSTVGTITSVVADSASVYTVTVNNISGDGTMRLDLKSSGTGIADLAANPIQTGYTSGAVYTFDYDSAMLESVGVPAAGVYTTGKDLDFTVTYSENVVVTGTPRIAITLGDGQTVYADYVSGSGGSTLTFQYVVAAGNFDSTGIVLAGNIDANGGGINDSLGNSAGTVLGNVGDTSHVLVDGTSPAVSSIVANGSTTGDTLTYTVTFNEAMTGVNAADFVLTATGSASGTVASVVSAGSSGTTYTVTVNNLGGDGTLRLDLNPSSGATDLDGLPVAGYTGAQAVTVDHAPASVTGVMVPSQGDYQPGQTLEFDVTFNQSVTVNTAGGVPTIALTLDSGTVQAHYVSGSGTDTLVFSYTVAAGDKDASGVVVAGAINANGAVISSSAGTGTSLTLTDVGSTTGVDVGIVAPPPPPPPPIGGEPGRGLLPGLQGPPPVGPANPLIWVVPQDAGSGPGAANQQEPMTGEDNWAPAALPTQQPITSGNAPGNAPDNTVGVGGFTGLPQTQTEQFIKPAAVDLPALQGSDSGNTDMLNWQPPANIQPPADNDLGANAAAITAGKLADAGRTQADRALAERMGQVAHLHAGERHGIVRDASVASQPATHNGKASLTQQFGRYGKQAWERDKAALMDNAKQAARRRVG